MTTATVYKVTAARALAGTVYRMHAHCDSCGVAVVHGGGTDRARVGEFLGHRASHCRCEGSRDGGYELVDPAGVTA